MYECSYYIEVDFAPATLPYFYTFQSKGFYYERWWQMHVLTRRLGESLIIGNDIKITVLNICKSQITLSVNDSQCVIVKLQESIPIRDGIIVKVVIIGKTRLKLGVEVPAGVTINREELYRKYQMS